MSWGGVGGGGGGGEAVNDGNRIQIVVIPDTGGTL